MWDEYIKLRQNNFQFVKNNQDKFFKVINTSSETPIIDNVVRWFNNGFFITRDEHFIERESRDGVDLSYTEYHFKICDNNLSIVFSETSRDSQWFEHLTDFIGDHLVIKGGVIEKSGTEFIPFKYSQEEAKHRLLLKVPVENSSKENICTNLANSLTYKARKENFKNLEYTNDYITYLKKEIYEINETIYHLLLRRYAYEMQEKFVFKKQNDLIKYVDKEFVLAKYDLTYMISEISNLLALSENLTINHWDKYNTHYSYKKIETDLQEYFTESDGQLINQRKFKLNEIISALNLEYFSFEKFKRISVEKEELYKKETAFINGRKVYIQEFQTFESNFQNKKANLQRIPCIYIREADFFDKKKFSNFHLVQDADDSSKFYVVDGRFINIDYITYNYNDYLDLLKLRKMNVAI